MIGGKFEARVIVARPGLNRIVSPAAALEIAVLKLPAPLSLLFVTVIVAA
jgi:hypothetical protein